MPPDSPTENTQDVALAKAKNSSPSPIAVEPPRCTTAVMEDAKKPKKAMSSEELEEKWEEALEEQLEERPTKKIKFENEIKSKHKARRTTYKDRAKKCSAASKAKYQAGGNSNAKAQTEGERRRKEALAHPRPSTRWVMLLSDECDLVKAGKLRKKDAILADRWPQPFLALLDLLLRCYEREIAVAQKITYEIKWYASVRRAIKKVVVGINKLGGEYWESSMGAQEREDIRTYIELVLDNAGVDKKSSGAMELADKWSTW